MVDVRELISVVIPAYNEEKSIVSIVTSARNFSGEVIVIDDGSIDKTAEIARKNGATVISHQTNKGYLEALRTGFKTANRPIIVTIDADGQHNPNDIPGLIQPIIQGEADLVIGAREKLSSTSEKLLTKLTRIIVNVSDASSGYRAIRSNIAKKMRLIGKCTCGTFIIEALRLGARISEVKLETRKRESGKSKMGKHHLAQTLILIKEIAAYEVKIRRLQIAKPDDA